MRILDLDVQPFFVRVRGSRDHIVCADSAFVHTVILCLSLHRGRVTTMYSDHPFGPNVAVSPANFDIASFARRPHLNVAMMRGTCHAFKASIFRGFYLAHALGRGIHAAGQVTVHREIEKSQ